MRDPVSTKYGHSFEREAIFQWIQKHEICPLTNQKLTRADIHENYSLKQAIDALIAAHKWYNFKK